MDFDKGTPMSKFQVAWHFLSVTSGQDDGNDPRGELTRKYKSGAPFTVEADSPTAAMNKARKEVKSRNENGFILMISEPSGLVWLPSDFPDETGNH